MRNWFLALALLPGAALAEQSLAFGDYLVHYIAMPSTALSPETARAYGVSRSRQRGVVVLNVQHQERPQIGVASRIEGEVRNLIGQIKTTEFREFREQDAIYSIGEFSFTNLETLTFRFRIQPQGSDTVGELRFSQQMYVNPD